MDTATNGQLKTLVAGILASSDPAVLAAIAARDYTSIVDWCNSNSTTVAWAQAVDKRAMFEAMNIATYDTVVTGKKEAWRLMLDLAPIDFSRQKMRKGVADIFDAADSNNMLAAFTEKATQAEAIIGGSTATTGTVSALKRGFNGAITEDGLRRFLTL